MEPPGEPSSAEPFANESGADPAENPPAHAPPLNPPADAVPSGQPDDSSETVGEGNSAPSEAESSVVAPPPVPVQAPLKPAAWQEKDAGEWFPEGFRAHLPLLEGYVYNDHFECEFAGPAGWRILAATRRGRLHAHRGAHREDAVRFAVGRDFIILCVSDGAGSCQYSRIGSELTCRTVVAELEKELAGHGADFGALDREALATRIATRIASAIVEATKAAVNALGEIARCTESTPKDFRCTLLTTVFYLGSQESFALASQVGDGFFAGLGRDGQARRYGVSDSGAYSGEVTCFVPDAEALNHAARIHSIDLAGLEAFVAATDGIEDPFYPLEKNAGALFRQLYYADEDPLPGFEAKQATGPVIGSELARERLAAWLAFEKKGENDDRTIAIIYRESASARQ
jgi:hypothetical protein